jgi:hypothetical protein
MTEQQFLEYCQREALRKMGLLPPSPVIVAEPRRPERGSVPVHLPVSKTLH